jgi:transcription elongation factor GreB
MLSVGVRIAHSEIFRVESFFVEEREERSGQDDIAEEEMELEPLEPGIPGSNLITAIGMRKLKDEVVRLMRDERPPVVEKASTLAIQGQTMEHVEYAETKRRLREIDRRLRFLNRRIELAKVVDLTKQDQKVVGFGAHVVTENEKGQKKSYQIVGEDEVDVSRGKISWKSPLAEGMMEAGMDDWVSIDSPGGIVDLHILSIKYDS